MDTGEGMNLPLPSSLPCVHLSFARLLNMMPNPYRA